MCLLVGLNDMDKISYLDFHARYLDIDTIRYDYVSTKKTIHLEFVKYTLMSMEEVIIILSIIIRHVLFISDTHCVSNFNVYSILFPVHQPLTFKYFGRSG